MLPMAEEALARVKVRRFVKRAVEPDDTGPAEASASSAETAGTVRKPPTKKARATASAAAKRAKAAKREGKAPAKRGAAPKPKAAAKKAPSARKPAPKKKGK